MSYEVFQRMVKALIEKAGGGITVEFSKDGDTGKHFAKCFDGTVIIGNGVSRKVEVRWNGQNHKAIVAI